MAKKIEGTKNIVVGGVTYAATPKGYYYKLTKDNTLTRISKADWEQAVADAEYENRKIAQAESDKAAEDAMNKRGNGTSHNEVGKQTAKQAKAKSNRTRRSKDVAYEGHGVTLTAKQVDFLQRVGEIDFEANNYETGLEHTMWCDVLVDMIGGQFLDKPMLVGAMVSTLREKGVIAVGVDRINGKKCKYFEFTDLGNLVVGGLQ